jgi:hypothetical protein
MSNTALLKVLFSGPGLVASNNKGRHDKTFFLPSHASSGTPQEEPERTAYPRVG